MKRLAWLLLLLVGCESEAPPLPEAFLGTWRSDEQLTLESLTYATAVPDDVRAQFENDFFGRLVVMFTETERSSFFIDQGQLPVTVEHNIADAGDNFVTFIEPANDELGLSTERTWYIDGDLIAVPIEEWGFTEYFRRVQHATPAAEETQ